MKQKLFTLLLAVTASVGTMFASTKIGDLYYNLNATKQTAEVTYQLRWDANNYSGLITAIIPTSVTYNSTTYSVTSIGDNAFALCSGLTSVTIPNSVTSIGMQAFCSCTGLTSITIGSGVTSWGQNAFNGCTSLTTVHISDLAAWCNISFDYGGASPLAYAHNLYLNGELVTDLIIPNSVTSIGNAFQGFSGLTSVTIPNSVTSIGSGAFSGCSGLTSVTIGNSVTRIGGYAFYNCSGLTSVTIGNSVTSIGDKAFYDCSGLTSMTCNAITPPSCAITPPSSASKVFYGVNVIPLHVPEQSISVYKSTPLWRLFNPIISTNKFIIKYVNWDGTEILSSEVTKDSMPHYSGATPTREATTELTYSFAGWTPEIVVATKDATYTATYNSSPRLYTITWLQDDGSLIDTTTVAYGKIPTHANPTKAETVGFTYTFTKWTPTITAVTGNATYRAKYSSTRKSYTITWLNEDGSLIDKTTVEYGKTPTHANPTKAATAEFTYTFAGWTPNVVAVTGDATYTATFNSSVNKYSISATAINGSVNGVGTYPYGTQVKLTAVPNYGYHFTQWSDGNTNNPRTFVLTQDTTFTAEFEKNSYTISTTSANQEWGTTAGDKSALYLEKVVISATANYGYHFVKWNDNNTENPRTISVTKDATYTATFAKNSYSITKIANSTQGSISGVSNAEYLDNVTLTVYPNYGYHFTHWSDGNTNNPSTFVLTQDTTFTAEFAIDKSGTCGDDNALTWTYDTETKKLTITGNGALNSNYTFGVEAPTQMQKLVIGNEVTSIGDSAFYGMSTINHLIIGGSVATIGNYAFAGCKNFDDITCYATNIPEINATTFANVGNKEYIYLYVPADSERAYRRDTYWGEFDIQIKSAASTTTDVVKVVPTETTAAVTWPAVSGAATYDLVIKDKSGNAICTLIFNAQGQLTQIAFNAPAQRDALQQMQAAGFSFVITGLEEGNEYNLAIIAKDSNGGQISAENISFTTTTPTAIDQITNGKVSTATKFIRDGKIYILRDGKVYDLTRREIM